MRRGSGGWLCLTQRPLLVVVPSVHRLTLRRDRHMRRVRWILGLGIFSIAVAGPGTVLGDGQAQGGGAGCKENGQAVAGGAQAPGPFGQFVSTQTPIADDVAAFKETLC